MDESFEGVFFSLDSTTGALGAWMGGGFCSPCGAAFGLSNVVEVGASGVGEGWPGDFGGATNTPFEGATIPIVLGAGGGVGGG